MITIKEFQLFRKQDLLELPINSEFINLSLKNDIISIWFRVNSTETEKVIRRFELYDNNEEIELEEDLQYLGTVYLNKDVHITERIDQNPDN